MSDLTEPNLAVNSGRLFRFVSAGLLGILLIGALAVSWTIPFQEWDAYSIGIWSRLIADGEPILSPKIDQIAHQRPLVPVPQGLIWRSLGRPSMRAARLFSLSFTVLLVVVTFLLARRLQADQTTAWIAAFLAGASPLVTEKVSAAMSDIPAAALFWAGVLTMLSAREKPRSLFWLWTGILWGLSALGKVTALPLCAAFTATTISYGIQRRWRWRSWLFMAIGLALPGYGVFRYWDAVRPPYGWAHFLYRWNVPYYGDLTRSSRLPALAHLNWFGIFLTLIFLVTVISDLPGRSRTAASLLLIGIGVWAAMARLISPEALREYGSGRLDGLMAGIPAIAVTTGVALALIRVRTPLSCQEEAEFVSIAALYFIAWLLALAYDRRFLVAVLPPVAICSARWLRGLGRAAAERRSRALLVAALVVFCAVTWEGARLMDRGYAAFSQAIISINHRRGLSPEAKMEEIFGSNMRIIAEVQEEIAARPTLRVISPDTRLPFFFGSHMDAFYATPANIANYDLLIWVNNTGILDQYRVVYGIPDPLNALRKTVNLRAIDETAEYELYRISRN